MPVKARPGEPKAKAQVKGAVFIAATLPLSPIRTLRISLLLLGEEGDVVIYRPDCKSSECKKEEEDDDDNRDGDVALNHVGWRRSVDQTVVER